MAEAAHEESDGIEEMQKNVAALKETGKIVDEVSDQTASNNEDEPEYTATQLKAMEKGWSPDKDNLPEGKEWIDAGEFLRNERLYNEIHKLKREVSGTKTALEVFKEHHKKVQEAEREKLLTQLKHQKKVALEDDDHDAIIEIDEQIADVKATANTPDEIDTATESNELFNSWVEKNDWYESDEDMRQTADEIGAAYFTRNNGKVTPADMYTYVEKRIKKLYPAKFEKPAPKKTAPQVEGAKSGQSRKASQKVTKYSAKDLSEDQYKVMKTFARQGVMTEQEYIEELVKIGELS